MTDRTVVTPGLLQAVGCSPARAIQLAPLLDAALLKADITSKNGVCMFLAQVAHESNNFMALEENLNYSVQGLLSTWPGRFTTLQAYSYGRTAIQPADKVMIANTAYGNRMGNIKQDDGYVFRGGGFIQLTGRANYTAFGESIQYTAEEAATYARTDKGAIESALWFWTRNKLINPAWKGDINTVTRIINGGLNGLADRKDRFLKALAYKEPTKK